MGGTAALPSCESVELSWFDETGAESRGPLAGSWSAAFERAASARAFGSFKGQRSFQGSWWFATTGVHVGFESWLERDVLMALDFDADVVAVSSQPFWLSWSTAGRARRHAPDFFARRADGSARVIDVRADDRIDEHDAEVFAATAEACASVGWDYERLGRLDPVWAANLRWLAGYRHRRCCTPSLADRLVECLLVPVRLGELAAMAGNRLAVLPTLYHLLWAGDRRGPDRGAAVGPDGGASPGAAVTVSRPARLAAGDEVGWRGLLFTISAVSEGSVALASVTGEIVAVSVADLLTDPGFTVSRPRQVPLPPRGVLEGLPEEVVARAQWWEAHVVELLHGVRPGSPPGTAPSFEYDPLRCTLRQREAAKVAELVAAGETASLTTVRRMRLRYQAEGFLGLVDGRLTREFASGMDERVITAIEKAVADETDRSTGTVTRLRRKVTQILAAEYGIDPTEVMPPRTTFYRLVAQISHGRHTFGSAPTGGRWRSARTGRSVR